MLAVARLLTFLASAPERLVRSVAALLGGGIHETASLALPRFVRRSRLYEATAKNIISTTNMRRRSSGSSPAPKNR